MTILDKIAAAARVRVKAAEELEPPEALAERARALPKGDFAFERALRKPGLSFICEVKKASPSKGVIAEDFPYLEIAADFEAAGADAVSVLTEPEFFMGADEYLSEISASVGIPALRKDFTVSGYQIYQAKTLGASAVLLICSILSGAETERFIALARELGLSALVETRNENEVKQALAAGASIVGVNNRDLRTFEVDLRTAERLREFVPDGIVFVAESGIRSPGDIRALSGARPDAALIGEAFMRSPRKAGLLSEMRAAADW